MRLGPPRPNPLTRVSSVSLELSIASEITIDVLDVTGRAVKHALSGERLGAGRHEIVWDGLDSRGVMVPDGIYLLRVRTATGSAMQRIVVLRSR